MTKTSIVIGFRNWGLDRLKNCIRSIHNSLDATDYEIIVSDLGSDMHEEVGSLAKSEQAQYVYTPSDVWSRSRALNKGFEIASGNVFMATDADMMFEPEALSTASRFVAEGPGNAVFIQCRDLPPSVGMPNPKGALDWHFLESVSSLRPRWGMGGLVAVSRSAFEYLGGLDERMLVYGGEDLDFATRLQRAGYRLIWLREPLCNMYHVWHPRSLPQANATVAGAAAVKTNQAILAKDPTIIRNTETRLAGRGHDPLVSVVIATRDRAHLIGDSINSVLAQTVQDFELIIINDGSEDDTVAVVKSFNDPRIRLFNQPPTGISAARNVGTKHALGKYVAVHDDDDLMLPERLQRSLSAIRPGIRATFGSWVNFDDKTGELFLQVSKKDFNMQSVFDTGAAPGHSTWLVETELMRELPYDETLSSAIDNNFAIKLMSSGVRWAHTGSILFLRRTHDGQVSITDSSNQKTAAVLTRNWAQFSASPRERKAHAAEGKAAPWPKLKEKDDLEAAVLAYLPEHLVLRNVSFTGDLDECRDQLDSATRLRARVEVFRPEGEREVHGLLLDVPLSDLAILRRYGIKFTQSAERRTSPAQRQMSDSHISEFVNRVIAKLVTEVEYSSSADVVIRPISDVSEHHDGSAAKIIVSRHGRGNESFLVEPRLADSERLQSAAVLLTRSALDAAAIERLMG